MNSNPNDFGESFEKASNRHETNQHKTTKKKWRQTQTYPSNYGEHQPLTHSDMAAHTAAQHDTQSSSSSTQAPKSSNEKPSFAVIKTGNWKVHDKVQRWIGEGPGEQPWNSMDASSLEMQDQGRNEGEE